MCRFKCCCCLRDIVLFLAGAEFFHTIAHYMLPFIVTFPLNIHVIELTENMNMGATFVNGVITILLLYWAYKLKGNCCDVKKDKDK